MRKVLASLHRSTEVRSFAARSWSFPFYGSRGEGTVISPQVDVKTCKSATAKPRRDTKRVFFLRCSRNPGIKSSLWPVRRWLGHSSGANVGSSQAGSSCSTVHHLRILYSQLASFDHSRAGAQNAYALARPSQTKPNPTKPKLFYIPSNTAVAC